MASSTLGKEQSADQEKEIVKGQNDLVLEDLGNQHYQREGFAAGHCVARYKEEDSLGDMSHGFIFYLGRKEASILYNNKHGSSNSSEKWGKAQMKHTKFILHLND